MSPRPGQKQQDTRLSTDSWGKNWSLGLSNDTHHTCTNTVSTTLMYLLRSFSFSTPQSAANSGPSICDCACYTGNFGLLKENILTFLLKITPFKLSTYNFVKYLFGLTLTTNWFNINFILGVFKNLLQFSGGFLNDDIVFYQYRKSVW